MPASSKPQPADDEIECGRCGAYFYYELTRCPNCGVSVFEPEDDPDQSERGKSRPAIGPLRRIGNSLEGLIRRLTKKPYAVEELFGTPINPAELYGNLLTKVGGDVQVVERLIEFERRKDQRGTRLI
jgi:hypothetical protein